MTFKPVIHNDRDTGTQDIYRFDNGYGASVIQGPYSYGGDEGKYEIGVIKFRDESNTAWSLTYSTPITDDVIGYVAPGDVQHYLRKISKLPKSQ